jgi:hypothetical protein
MFYVVSDPHTSPLEGASSNGVMGFKTEDELSLSGGHLAGVW